MNNFVLLSTGPGNPLLDIGFRSDFALSQLWPAAVIVSLLLAHTAYTDIFCGRIIRNPTVGTLACLALALEPLLFSNPLQHFLLGFGCAFVVGCIFWFSNSGEGDIKLYGALAFFLGQATIALFLISIVIVLLYSIPIIVKTLLKRKEQEEKPKRGARLGTAPMAPGIAIAFPLTLAAVGLPLYQAGLMLAVEAFGVGFFYLDAKIEAKAKAKAELKEQSDSVSA